MRQAMRDWSREPVAGLTLCAEGKSTLERLQRDMPNLQIFQTQTIAEQYAQLRKEFAGIVFAMPMGVVARVAGPLLESKLTDPALVVMDVRGRWSIAWAGGHEGGANRLCELISWALDAEPIVTTTSEAQRNLVVGIGCRRGVSVAEVLCAIDLALGKMNAQRSDVRLLASADLKRDELALHQAAQLLNAGLRFISSQRISQWGPLFGNSEFVQEHVQLPGVAEPCAMLAGSRTCLVLPKLICGSVTVALAKEN